MSRVCSRPGCTEPATATFAYAPSQLAAWIGDLADDRRAIGHDLCDTHADRLSVPAGWTLTDERTQPEPRVSLSAVDPASPMLARAFRAAKAS
ncbi:MAG: DUF3499 family protein [Acidimicrobiales bacterium]|nr:DUF3499 family protein [Acidimicrobiales bacterium]